MSSPLTPSLKSLRNLVGKSNTGISKAYGMRSIANVAQQAANKSASPIHALRGKIGGIMETIKKVDSHADRELHQGGFSAARQKNLIKKLNEKGGLDTLQKKEVKTLIKALGKDDSSNKQMRSVATAKMWQRQRTMEESLSQPQAITSISQKKQSTAFQMRGDKIVRGVAGQVNTAGAVGSIADLTSRRPPSLPSQSKPLSGGLRPIYKPKY